MSTTTSTEGQGRGVGMRDEQYGEDPENPTPQPELFSLFEEESGGSRPPAACRRRAHGTGSGLPCGVGGGERRRETSWWRYSRPSISWCPSRLSKCPRSRSHPVVASFLSFAVSPWNTRRRSSGGGADCRVFLLSAADCRAEH